MRLFQVASLLLCFAFLPFVVHSQMASNVSSSHHDREAGIIAAAQIVSCGTPLAGLNVKIVDPERHVALPPGRVCEIWVAGESKCLCFCHRTI